MKKNVFYSIALVALLFSSCATPNVSYFNDMGNGQTEIIQQIMDIRLRPDDKISIVVNSKDPLLADLFNLPIISHRVGYSQASGSSSSQSLSVYTIDKNGEIDFPVLGKLKISGFRRDEVGELIKSELIKRNLVKDPILTVEYANLGFNVLGEVNKPGRYTFDRDHLTILDAISLAGDLTIQGRRYNVFVMRETGNQMTTYRVNLQSGKELLQSPVFYIQQNDVIYVEPNSYRSRQTTVNGNNILSASFWISVASLLTSIAVLIVK
ncbi:MAG: polysaccharide biosynthesis/export family protein [Prevotella sp.]|nr:polysaccharide biosynthesis/export family protein [Prevotella sp.]